MFLQLYGFNCSFGRPTIPTCRARPKYRHIVSQPLLKMDIELEDTLNKQWKNDKTTFGFRMMQKMGWKGDTGLGKNETGIVDNVKVSKREIGLGLGMEESADGAGNKAWSETANSFNAVLEVLKKSYGKKDKKKKAEKSTKITTISVGMK